MKRILLFNILVFSLIGCSFTQASAQRKLLILGSSTSSCTIGQSTTGCYVNRLKTYYAQQGAPIQVANRAVAGEDVYRGMPTSYTPPPGRRNPNAGFNITDGLREENPDVVLISYPSNGYDVFTVKEVMFCLRTIKQTANAAGKPCFVTTSQPRYDEFTFNTSAVRRTLAEIKDSVLAEFGTYAIDFWSGLVNNADTTLLPQFNWDGTHPNDAGHGVLLQQMINKNIFNIALPLQLVNFAAENSGNAVSIEWTVEAEKEMRSYQLEKSSDGRIFSKVYEVTALNVSKSHRYTFTDVAVARSAAYYRLGMVGKDNFLNYSQTIEVKGVGGDNAEKVYLSNNFTLAATLNADKNKQVKLGIFNSTGQLLMETTRSLSAGMNNLSIGISNLKTGLYFLKVYGQNIDSRARPFSKP
ncbi:MAG: T9SS type A sorting domain-containing protein [Chitinophagaceae bacterium]